jgi:hypothetical protein
MCRVYDHIPTYEVPMFRHPNTVPWIPHFRKSFIKFWWLRTHSGLQLTPR